ncbi:MAG TPA: hypothetical protein VI230_02895 [Ignavibacteriaceae bacterium]
MRSISSSFFSILSILLSTLFVLYGCSSINYEKKQLEKGELYFDNQIARDKVEGLSNFINQCAIFNDEVHKARLAKSNDAYELSLAVPPEMINSDQYQDYAEILAMQLSDDVFNKALVKIHLTDDNFNSKVTKSSRAE